MIFSKSINISRKAGFQSLFFVMSVFVGLVSPATHAQDQISSLLDPRLLYERMLESKRLYDFQGILTYEQAGQMQSFEVSSRLRDSALDQKLSQLDGPHVEHFIRFDTNCNPRREVGIERLGNYYNFFSVGEVRVAGREGTEIVLMPVDKYRNGYQFVIDDETGLMLRSVVTAPDRRVVERTQFVNISFEPREITDEAVLPSESQLSGNDALIEIDKVAETEAEISASRPQDNSQIATENNGQEMAAGESVRAPDSVGCNQFRVANGWGANWLPEGFGILESSLQDERAVLVFGDGISVVSVFIEPVQETFLPPSNAHRGATSIYINYLSTSSETYLVSVVGEVPMATAERLFASLRPE